MLRVIGVSAAVDDPIAGAVGLPDLDRRLLIGVLTQVWGQGCGKGDPVRRDEVGYQDDDAGP